MAGSTAALAAALVASLVLSACGSSATSAAGGNSSTATGSPVTVGVIGSFSGVQASSEGGVPEVMQAWEVKKLLNCQFETRMVNGKWTEPDGLTPTCAPATVINGIVAKLGGQ